jgi:hypothetical protein
MWFNLSVIKELVQFWLFGVIDFVAILLYDPASFAHLHNVLKMDPSPPAYFQVPVSWPRGGDRGGQPGLIS